MDILFNFKEQFSVSLCACPSEAWAKAGAHQSGYASRYRVGFDKRKSKLIFSCRGTYTPLKIYMIICLTTIGC